MLFCFSNLSLFLFSLSKPQATTTFHPPSPHWLSTFSLSFSLPVSPLGSSSTFTKGLIEELLSSFLWKL
ncbi:unnamed protein product [Lathyrus oleraceus]